jgi:polyisoprenoid-binding protein YceI
MVHRAFWLLVLAATGTALAAPRNYAVDEGRSTASAHVGKTGIASFAGHEHVVVARTLQGEVQFDPQDLPQSSVDVVVDARSLTVREEGEPDGDAAKVQKVMQSPGQLDVMGHRLIHFRSTRVQGRQTGPTTFDLAVSGELTLRGKTRPFQVPIHLEVQGNELIASGKLTVKLSDFGIEPTAAAGGLVKVENDVPIDFKIGARASRM